jgi:lysozyme family protein
VSDFDIAVNLTLIHEGGYVNDPCDPGGPSNMGILQSDVPDIPIQTLTRAQAIEYYKQHFWPILYNDIKSQAVGSKLFDMGVLFGLKEAIELIQQATMVEMTGEFGPYTLSVMNKMTDTVLLQIYENRLRQHAQNVVAAKPQTAKFLQGWLNRIAS